MGTVSLGTTCCDVCGSVCGIEHRSIVVSATLGLMSPVHKYEWDVCAQCCRRTARALALACRAIERHMKPLAGMPSEMEALATPEKELGT